MDANEVTTNDRIASEIIHTLKHDIGKYLTFEDVEFAIKHMVQIANYALLLAKRKLDRNDLKMREFKKLRKSPYADISTKFLLPQLDCIDKKFELLNFPGFEHFGHVIDMTKFVEHEQGKAKSMDQSRTDANRGDQRDLQKFSKPGPKKHNLLVQSYSKFGV